MKIVKLQTLRSEFETLKVTHTENVDEFMTRVVGIVNEIKLISETISDEKIVQKVLQSLPKKYDIIVTTFLESKDLTTFLVE